MAQTFLVETYWAESNDVAVRAGVARVTAAARELRADGRSIAFLGSLLVPDDELCFWRFAATSVVEVAEVSRQAGLDVHRIARSIEIVDAEPKEPHRWTPTSS